MDGKLIAKLSRTELEKRLNDPYSCLESAEYDQHLMISPKYLGRIAEGIREQLNAKLNFYSEKIGGVPVLYRKIQLKRNTGWLMEDQPHIHLDVTVDFIVFRPTEGAKLRAVANARSTGEHVGGIVHGLFNVSVPLGEHRNASHFEEGDEFFFRVTAVNVANSILSMTGKLAKSHSSKH